MGKKVCNYYVCSKYPECEHAGGMGCDTECWIPDAEIIPDESCTEENGYPMFKKKERPGYGRSE